MAIKANNKIYLSWDDITSSVDKLCESISKSTFDIKSVTGLKRGGLIPAVLISHKLNIPYVESINIHTLVVDDICDTGGTLLGIVTPFTAVLHHKPTAKFEPTFFAEEVGDEWIVYPWERSDSEAIQDYLRK
jgi:hypoxanthine phosphoribosyltransferase